MIVVLVTVVNGVLAGAVAWWAVRRWWRLDTTAPRLTAATVEDEARRHPRLAAWTQARLNPTVITGLLLTLAIIAIAVGVAGFGIVLAMVRTHRGFADFDLGAARWGARHATTASTAILRAITRLGSVVVLLPLAVVVAAVEIRRQRDWSVLGFLVVVVGGQYLASNVIKAAVDRARPDISPLATFSGPSFPSGHATAAAAVLAAFAMLIGRRRSRAVKAALPGVAVGVAVAVASSRVLLGVHWLTDVMAGLPLGWAWFALSSVAFGGRLLRFGAPVEAAMTEAAAMTQGSATTEGSATTQGGSPAEH